MMLFPLVGLLIVDTALSDVIPGVLKNDGLAISSLSCPTPAIRNGAAKLKKRGTRIRYKCYQGFTRVGPARAKCQRGSWKPRKVPTCISTGCDIPLEIENGSIENVTLIGRTQVSSGSVLRYSCNPGHTMVGDSFSWCDGFLWNSSSPLCQAPHIPPPTSCTFNHSDLCGWSQLMSSTLDWTLHNSSTPTTGTGPTEPTGTYIFLESSARKINDSSKIYSPVYPGRLSNDACFVIKVCMYGADMGDLFIGTIPEERPEEITVIKTLSGNYGENWVTLAMNVRERDTPWQVVIEGRIGGSYLSDIAVGEVQLLHGDECYRHSYYEMVNVLGRQLSPVSCWGRCEKNGSHVASEEGWNEGVCDCTPHCLLGSAKCCADFIAQCNHNKILPRMDTPSWMTWSMVSGGVAIAVIVLMSLLVLASSYCKTQPPQQDYMEEDDEMKYIMEEQEWAGQQEGVRLPEWAGQQEGVRQPEWESQPEWECQQEAPPGGPDGHFTADFSEFIDFTMASAKPVLTSPSTPI